MQIFNIVITMIWLMLPAYLANPAAAISAKIKGINTPVDFGQFLGSERILGDGKTYKGIFVGITFGCFIGFLEVIANSLLFNHTMPNFSVLSIFALSFGSMMGDLIASFFKRRLRIASGEKLFPVDQLDFVFGCWIAALLIVPHWFIKNFTVPIILATLILTPIFHRIFNIVGYKLGISRHPW